MHLVARQWLGVALFLVVFLVGIFFTQGGTHVSYAQTPGYGNEQCKQKQGETLEQLKQRTCTEVSKGSNKITTGKCTGDGVCTGEMYDGKEVKKAETEPPPLPSSQPASPAPPSGPSPAPQAPSQKSATPTGTQQQSPTLLSQYGYQQAEQLQNPDWNKIDLRDATKYAVPVNEVPAESILQQALKDNIGGLEPQSVLPTDKPAVWQGEVPWGEPRGFSDPTKEATLKWGTPVQYTPSAIEKAPTSGSLFPQEFPKWFDDGVKSGLFTPENGQQAPIISTEGNGRLLEQAQLEENAAQIREQYKQIEPYLADPKTQPENFKEIVDTFNRDQAAHVKKVATFLDANFAGTGFVSPSDPKATVSGFVQSGKVYTTGDISLSGAPREQTWVDTFRNISSGPLGPLVDPGSLGNSALKWYFGETPSILRQDPIALNPLGALAGVSETPQFTTAVIAQPFLVQEGDSFVPVVYNRFDGELYEAPDPSLYPALAARENAAYRSALEYERLRDSNERLYNTMLDRQGDPSIGFTKEQETILRDFRASEEMLRLQMINDLRNLEGVLIGDPEALAAAKIDTMRLDCSRTGSCSFSQYVQNVIDIRRAETPGMSLPQLALAAYEGYNFFVADTVHGWANNLRADVMGSLAKNINAFNVEVNTGIPLLDSAASTALTGLNTVQQFALRDVPAALLTYPLDATGFTNPTGLTQCPTGSSCQTREIVAGVIGTVGFDVPAAVVGPIRSSLGRAVTTGFATPSLPSVTATQFTEFAPALRTAVPQDIPISWSSLTPENVVFESGVPAKLGDTPAFSVFEPGTPVSLGPPPVNPITGIDTISIKPDGEIGFTYRKADGTVAPLSQPPAIQTTWMPQELREIPRPLERPASPLADASSPQIPVNNGMNFPERIFGPKQLDLFPETIGEFNYLDVPRTLLDGPTPNVGAAKGTSQLDLFPETLNSPGAPTSVAAAPPASLAEPPQIAARRAPAPEGSVAPTPSQALQKAVSVMQDPTQQLVKQFEAARDLVGILDSASLEKTGTPQSAFKALDDAVKAGSEFQNAALKVFNEADDKIFGKQLDPSLTDVARPRDNFIKALDDVAREVPELGLARYNPDDVKTLIVKTSGNTPAPRPASPPAPRATTPSLFQKSVNSVVTVAQLASILNDPGAMLMRNSLPSNPIAVTDTVGRTTSPLATLREQWIRTILQGTPSPQASPGVNLRAVPSQAALPQPSLMSPRGMLPGIANIVGQLLGLSQPAPVITVGGLPAADVPEYERITNASYDDTPRVSIVGDIYYQLFGTRSANAQYTSAPPGAPGIERGTQLFIDWSGPLAQFYGFDQRKFLQHTIPVYYRETAGGIPSAINKNGNCCQGTWQIHESTWNIWLPQAKQVVDDMYAKGVLPKNLYDEFNGQLSRYSPQQLNIQGVGRHDGVRDPRFNHVINGVLGLVEHAKYERVIQSIASNEYIGAAWHQAIQLSPNQAIRALRTGSDVSLPSEVRGNLGRYNSVRGVNTAYDAVNTIARSPTYVRSFTEGLREAHRLLAGGQIQFVAAPGVPETVTAPPIQINTKNVRVAGLGDSNLGNWFGGPQFSQLLREAGVPESAIISRGGYGILQDRWVQFVKDVETIMKQNPTHVVMTVGINDAGSVGTQAEKDLFVQRLKQLTSYMTERGAQVLLVEQFSSTVAAKTKNGGVINYRDGARVINSLLATVASENPNVRIISTAGYENGGLLEEKIAVHFNKNSWRLIMQSAFSNIFNGEKVIPNSVPQIAKRAAAPSVVWKPLEEVVKVPGTVIVGARTVGLPVGEKLVRTALVPGEKSVSPALPKRLVTSLEKPARPPLPPDTRFITCDVAQGCTAELVKQYKATGAKVFNYDIGNGGGSAWNEPSNLLQGEAGVRRAYERALANFRAGFDGTHWDNPDNLSESQLEKIWDAEVRAAKTAGVTPTLMIKNVPEKYANILARRPDLRALVGHAEIEHLFSGKREAGAKKLADMGVAVYAIEFETSHIGSPTLSKTKLHEEVERTKDWISGGLTAPSERSYSFNNPSQFLGGKPQAPGQVTRVDGLIKPPTISDVRLDLPTREGRVQYSIEYTRPAVSGTPSETWPITLEEYRTLTAKGREAVRFRPIGDENSRVMTFPELRADYASIYNGAFPGADNALASVLKGKIANPTLTPLGDVASRLPSELKPLYKEVRVYTNPAGERILHFTYQNAQIAAMDKALRDAITNGMLPPGTILVQNGTDMVARAPDGRVSRVTVIEREVPTAKPTENVPVAPAASIPTEADFKRVAEDVVREMGGFPRLDTMWRYDAKGRVFNESGHLVVGFRMNPIGSASARAGSFNRVAATTVALNEVMTRLLGEPVPFSSAHRPWGIGSKRHHCGSAGECVIDATYALDYVVKEGSPVAKNALVALANRARFAINQVVETQGGKKDYVKLSIGASYSGTPTMVHIDTYPRPLERAYHSGLDRGTLLNASYQVIKREGYLSNADFVAAFKAAGFDKRPITTVAQPASVPQTTKQSVAIFGALENPLQGRTLVRQGREASPLGEITIPGDVPLGIVRVYAPNTGAVTPTTLRETGVPAPVAQVKTPPVESPKAEVPVTRPASVVPATPLSLSEQSPTLPLALGPMMPQLPPDSIRRASVLDESFFSSLSSWVPPSYVDSGGRSPVPGNLNSLSINVRGLIGRIVGAGIRLGIMPSESRMEEFYNRAFVMNEPNDTPPPDLSVPPQIILPPSSPGTPSESSILDSIERLFLERPSVEIPFSPPRTENPLTVSLDDDLNPIVKTTEQIPGEQTPAPDSAIDPSGPGRFPTSPLADQIRGALGMPQQGNPSSGSGRATGGGTSTGAPQGTCTIRGQQLVSGICQCSAGQIVVNNECVAQSSSSQPSLSCSPQQGVLGEKITVTWSCPSNTTSLGVGFSTDNRSAGSASALIPSTATTTARFILRCSEKETSCSVTVSRPSATLIAQPARVENSGDSVRLLWASVRATTCRVLAPDCSILKEGGQSGSVTTPISRSGHFTLSCSTRGDAITVKQLVQVLNESENEAPEPACTNIPPLLVSVESAPVSVAAQLEPVSSSLQGATDGSCSLGSGATTYLACIAKATYEKVFKITSI